MNKLTILCIFWFLNPALAEVDMRNGNYYDSWEDLSIPSDRSPFKIVRYYNSRSLFSGMFGFGWCSEFESHLSITVEGNVSVTECGGGQEILFITKSYSPQKVTSNIDQIIEKVKVQKRHLGSAYLNDLKEKLITDETLRKKLSSDLGLNSSSQTTSTDFFATNGKSDRIEFDGSIFTRTTSLGSIQKFDSQGKLISLQSGPKDFFKITYTSGKISSIVDGSSKKLNFTYNPSGRVKTIVGPANIQAEYRFEGENLVGVTNGWGNKYSYQYDSVHNLNRINYPDGTYRQLNYDEHKDLITMFRDRAGCSESFTYTISTDEPKLHYWSNSEKKCEGKTVSSSKFEFWHKERADKQKALTRILSTVKGITKDITLDPMFGRPISVKEKSSTTTFDYFESGMLRSKIMRDENKPFFVKTIFTYDKSNKISSLESTAVDAKGNESNKSKILYQYNDKGLLSEVSTGSSTVQISYDKEFKINKITDAKNISYMLSYDQQNGKPREVKSQGGSLEIIYSPNGDVQSIKSSGGPEMAKKISSGFANLMTLLQAADVKINI